MENLKKLKKDLEIGIFKKILESDLSILSKELNLTISDLLSIVSKNIGLDGFVFSHLTIFKYEILFRYYRTCEQNAIVKQEFVNKFDGFLKNYGFDFDYTEFVDKYKKHKSWNLGFRLPIMLYTKKNIRQGIEKGLLFDSDENIVIDILDRSQKILCKADYFNLEIKIDKYIHEIDWTNLTANRLIKWNSKLLNKYYIYIDWNELSGRNDLDWNEDFLTEFQDALVWTNYLNFTPYTYNGHDYEYDFETHNFRDDKLNCISFNNGIQWNLDLIRKFENKIDFFLLSKIGKIDFQIIKQFEHKWDEKRKTFSSREKLSASDEIITDYENSSWENLSNNPNLVMTKEFYLFISSLNDLEIENSIESINNLFQNKKSKIKMTKLFSNLIVDESFILEIINEPFLYHNIFYDWEFCNQSIIEFVFNNTIKKKQTYFFGLNDPVCEIDSSSWWFMI